MCPTLRQAKDKGAHPYTGRLRESATGVLGYDVDDLADGVNHISANRGEGLEVLLG